MVRERPDRFHVRSATSRRANCSCCCISLRVREAAAPEIRMRPSSPRSAPSSTQRNGWEGQSGSGEAAMWDSSRGVFIGNGPERRHYHYHPPRDYRSEGRAGRDGFRGSRCRTPPAPMDTLDTFRTWVQRSTLEGDEYHERSASSDTQASLD